MPKKRKKKHKKVDKKVLKVGVSLIFAIVLLAFLYVVVPERGVGLGAIGGPPVDLAQRCANDNECAIGEICDGAICIIGEHNPLIAHYSFDDSDNLGFDSMEAHRGSNNHGNLLHSVRGPFNFAAEFIDEQSLWIEEEIILDEGFTIMFWIKFPEGYQQSSADSIIGWQMGSRKQVIDFGGVHTDNELIWYSDEEAQIGGTNRLRLLVKDFNEDGVIAENDEAISASEIPVNEWVHYTITRNENDFIEIYKNGIIDQPYDESAPSPSPEPAFFHWNEDFTLERIGSLANQNHVNYRLDELKVFNRALTEEEINREYQFSRPRTEICDDGIDNDEDGEIDCADGNCQARIPINADLCWESTCDDGEDNDGDNLIDAADPDCNTELICDDGIDNDGDNFIDADDPDCQSCGDGTCNPVETCPDDCLTETHCDDWVDNDDNGLFDCQEPECSDEFYCSCGDGVCEINEECRRDCEVEMHCSDGKDNDKDGWIDCADRNCEFLPECGGTGRATIIIRKNSQLLDECEDIDGSGNSCEEVCENEELVCVNPLDEHGEEDFKHCINSLPCGEAGEGICAPTDEDSGVNQGTGAHFVQYDSMTCVAGDGCTAVDADTGLPCNPDNPLLTTDPDCGGATCNEGNGIVWGCSFVSMCQNDGSCRATFDGNTCNAPDPDCGDATCEAGDGCVLECEPKDRDCGTSFWGYMRMTAVEAGLDVADLPGARGFTCNPYDGCSATAPAGTPCDPPDPDCGDATCAAEDGCAKYCLNEEGNFINEPDCHNDQIEINSCEAGNSCVARDKISAVNYVTCDFPDPDCGQATCGIGDGCVKNCETDDPDCIGVRGCGAGDKCTFCDNLINEVAWTDLDCGDATCVAGNGCVKDCDPADPDCNPRNVDPDLGWYNVLEMRGSGLGEIGLIFGYTFLWPFVDITCGTGEESSFNSMLVGGDGCVAVNSLSSAKFIGEDTSGNTLCAAEGRDCYSCVKDGAEVQCDNLQAGIITCFCSDPENIYPPKIHDESCKVEPACEGDECPLRDPDCGGPEGATCAEGDGCVMDCGDPGDPDCGWKVCNGFSFANDFACNTPGSCQCREGITFEDCNCCPEQIDYSGTCHISKPNSFLTVDLLAGESHPETKEELLANDELYRECCSLLIGGGEHISWSISEPAAAELQGLDSFFASYEETITISCIHDAPGEVCGNNLDDDGDGLMDCADHECRGDEVCEFGAEVTCDDNIDNDVNGLVDCADQNCVNTLTCILGDCGTEKAEQEWYCDGQGNSIECTAEQKGQIVAEGKYACDGTRWVECNKEGEVVGNAFCMNS